MKKRIAIVISSLALILGCGASIIAHAKNEVFTPTFASYTNGDGATYYNGISDSLTGDSLLSALRSLNGSKRKATVGYSGMGTSPSGQFKYTDYDTNTVKYDSNGQPYGEKIISFYSGNTTTSFNREHVWPNSHGGNVIENDIHMPRPTIASENGSRGNSFYVEGKCSSTSGWDPAMESFGKESYRGDSARIIFYCMLVDSKLSLIEADSHSTSNSNKDYMMGRLSDLIKWNINYPVEDREKRRNEGAEYLQGNRNPFIDHPEYACKIWGNANAATKALCANDTSGDTTGGDTTTTVTISQKTASLEIDGTVNLTATSSDSSNITWSTTDSTVASLNKTETASGGYVTVTANKAGSATIFAQNSEGVKNSCVVTVTSSGGSGGGDVTEATLVTSNSQLAVGNYVIAKTAAGIGVTGWNNSKDATVSETESEWKQFLVSSANSNGFTLKDEAANNYIASPGGNEFKYGDAGTCSVDSEGHLKCNNRYLCKNGNNYRFYTSIGSYPPFFLYQVPSSSVATKELDSISVTGATTSYFVGDAFSFDGTVTATYDDESIATVSPTSVSSPDMSTAGNKTVTVTYTEGGVTKTTTYTINVQEIPTVLSLAVTGALSKTNYYNGDSFVSSGLTVTATYSDSSTKDVTNQMSWTPNPLTTGTTSVTGTFEGKTVTVNGITVLPLSLTSISTVGQKTEFETGSTFTYNGTCTASYVNNTQKEVTPVVDSSKANMNVPGTYTITLSYTEGGITKTTSYTITVTDTPFVNTIEQCYTKSNGATVTNVYGMYVGSGDGKSPVIMNGEYGITVFDQTHVDYSGWTINTTCVKLSGTIDIYNGTLYEIKNVTSITVITDQAEITKNIAPVAVYDVTGSESTSDVTIASRVCLLHGIVDSDATIPSVGNEGSLDFHIGGETIQIYVKKNHSESELLSALTKSKSEQTEVTLKGYTTFYKTTFQIYPSEAIEVSDDYKAADFAQDLLDLTAAACSSSGSKEGTLSGIWITLETEYFAKLSTDEVDVLLATIADEYGSTTENAMARYDLICRKYASCRNFIGRGSANRSSNSLFGFMLASNSTIIIVASSVAFVAISSVAIYFLLKKKKHQ